MVEKATGIVLRTRRLTESSLIVQWLTAESGRLATVAKGALRPKSPFRGKLDLFYSADFSFSRSRASELHTLREVTLLETHSSIRTELLRLEQACYFAELLEKSTESETPIPELFELMRQALAYLPRQNAANSTVYAFEVKLLDHLGLLPDSASVPEPVARIIQLMADGTWDDLERLALGNREHQQLRTMLQRWLGQHLSRIPKERDAALGQYVTSSTRTAAGAS